jgi:hypothetical protein
MNVMEARHRKGRGLRGGRFTSCERDREDGWNQKGGGNCRPVVHDLSS